MLMRDMITDFDNVTGDTGRMLTVFVVVAMVGLQAYALYRGQVWNPGEFGGGIGFVLGALAAYLWGDSKARPGRVTTIESSSATETVHQEAPRGIA